MATYEIIESKAHLVTADSEDEAYRKFGNYEHDEESDYITTIRKIEGGRFDPTPSS
jgi:hypothetical protein